MIDPKAIVTYAQYNEDIILSALLEDVDKGFYVDIGANSPTIDSVTKLFYERGWRGINIEPIKRFYEQLKKDRPEDINLQLGAGSKPGNATFREYPKNHGFSTFEEAQKKQHGQKYPYQDYEVEIKTLKQIFNEHKVGHIHFLKIDAEGYEYDVIAGNDWRLYRPSVICIESSHITRDWRPELINNDYTLFITDGLNDYYIAKEAWARTENFDHRVTKAHVHALKFHQYRSWEVDSQLLNKLTKQIVDLQSRIEVQKAEAKKIYSELQRIAELSLVDQPLRERLKRVARGLTSDWRQYKRQSKRSRK